MLLNIDGCTVPSLFDEVKLYNVTKSYELLPSSSNISDCAKSRYISQGFREKMKAFVVHSLPTLRQSSIRIIVSCVAMLGFRICLLEITQAYLKSKDKLSRQIYITPKRRSLSCSVSVRTGYFRLQNYSMECVIRETTGVKL